jgi:hypothetical protein
LPQNAGWLWNPPPAFKIVSKENPKSLLFQCDGILRDLIERRNYASIGFVAALRDDQVRKLGGDVDVGLFEGAVGDAAESSARRRTDRGLAGSQGWRIGVISVTGQTLLVREAGKRDLSDDSRCSVAEGSGNGAIGPDAETLQRATGSAILLNGGGAAGGGRLGYKSPAGGVEQVPGEGKRAGAVGENGLGICRGRNLDGRVGGRGGAAGGSDTLKGSVAIELARETGAVAPETSAAGSVTA